MLLLTDLYKCIYVINATSFYVIYKQTKKQYFLFCAIFKGILNKYFRGEEREVIKNSKL